MAVQFKLRLLSGELIGRELTLPEGVFTLGEQGCDVLLSLPLGQILTLVISESQVMLQSSDAVWVNGFRHDSQLPIPLRQVIEAAGLALILGEETDVLSEIKVTRRSGSRLLLWLSMAIFGDIYTIGTAFCIYFLVYTAIQSVVCLPPSFYSNTIIAEIKKTALGGNKRSLVGRWQRCIEWSLCIILSSYSVAKFFGF
ncbi:type-III secretion protein [Yersinia enterocolitica]|nr:type-III secretion protein [Yersinia enterocolitica]